MTTDTRALDEATDEGRKRTAIVEAVAQLRAAEFAAEQCRNATARAEATVWNLHRAIFGFLIEQGLDLKTLRSLVNHVPDDEIPF